MEKPLQHRMKKAESLISALRQSNTTSPEWSTIVDIALDFLLNNHHTHKKEAQGLTTTSATDNPAGDKRPGQGPNSQLT